MQRTALSAAIVAQSDCGAQWCSWSLSGRVLPALALICFAAFIAACNPLPAPIAMKTRLSGVRAQLGHSAPGAESSYLRYRVKAHDGHWTFDMLRGPGFFVQRKRRRDDTRIDYEVGRDERGSWIRVGGGEALEVSDSWSSSLQTDEALFGMKFLDPAGSDETTYMGKWGSRWEFAYRPQGARTLTFGIDRKSQRLKAYDMVDDFGRLVQCKGLRFKRLELGPVLSRARCKVSNASHKNPEHALLDYRLEKAGPPESAQEQWGQHGAGEIGHPAVRRLERDLLSAHSIPIGDPRRPTVPLRIGGGKTIELILDSGAFHTVLSPSISKELGIIPTGEAPLFVLPPWLSASNLWVGLADTIRLGSAEWHGDRVLVAQNKRMLGQDNGILGADFFERFIVELDNPNGMMRIWPRSLFAPEPGFVRMRMPDSGEASIEGEVEGVASGLMVLDTGMSEDIVVHHWKMKLEYPREKGREAMLGAGPDSAHPNRSPDYYTRVRGIRLGPFPFPAMDAIGRDRERDLVGSGVAVVGMGVMRYFRIAFDFKGRTLLLWPGDAYTALIRSGMDIEDGATGITIDRIVENSPAARAKVRPGDVLLSVEGKPVAHFREARKAIAGHPKSRIRLGLLRRQQKLFADLQLNEPPEHAIKKN